MDEIINLVAQRSVNREILSEEDIKFICEIIIKVKHYKAFVDDISFPPIYNNSGIIVFGKYEDNHLYFYKDGIEFIKSFTLNLKANVFSKVASINYQILNSIFHEFAHVRQKKILYYNIFGEARIYYMCRKLEELDYFYNENYQYLPDEVNARALGCLNSYRVYQYLPNDIINENKKDLYKKSMFDTILSSYEIDIENKKIKSPSEILLEQARNYELSKCHLSYKTIKNNIDFHKNYYNLYRKVLLGLPISFDDYILIRSENNDLMKKIIKKEII